MGDKISSFDLTCVRSLLYTLVFLVSEHHIPTLLQHLMGLTDEKFKYDGLLYVYL